MYVLPLIIVLTAITAFRIVQEPPSEPEPPPTPAAPVSIGEAPSGSKFTKQLAAAELPDGGPIPAAGKGAFHVVPGASQQVGHFFGDHQPCADNGGLAPVMMQQTLSTADNDLAELTTQNPQGAVIPHDDKVCQPNPWPFPVAGQGR